MKHFSIIAFLLISFFSTNAQVNNNSGIVFDTTVYNFGVIEKGSDAECVFSFINKSKTVVILTNVKTSCNCTAPTWTKEPVKPGDSGKINVKYNTSKIGAFSKVINVYTNINEQSIILTIKGEVKKK